MVVFYRRQIIAVFLQGMLDLHLSDETIRNKTYVILGDLFFVLIFG